ncbi:precorrin-6A synthase (deacetylating) [Pseudomonas sp. nanlin1]|uniref:precorrin-6A synthase (deacetylating) n=1 Tax=Pseudomonas sp. nanlin1 TaxID=3040605 RepID=UPI00388E3CD8
MKRILVIGIGAGNPDHLTLQAVKAMNRADAFFLLDKGPQKSLLTDLRRQLCREHVQDRAYRLIEAQSPEWARGSDDYCAAVEALNEDKQALFGQLIDQLGVNECGAFLVWGDPTLYDSTLRILDGLLADAPGAFEVEVIPGISSLQALTACHQVPLNELAGAVTITTGRRLAASAQALGDSTLVMLDARDAYLHLLGQGLHIYWGAYLGTADELLIAGPLDEVAERIARTREQARQQHGWIMDTYLLKREPQPF